MIRKLRCTFEHVRYKKAQKLEKSRYIINFCQIITSFQYFDRNCILNKSQVEQSVSSIKLCNQSTWSFILSPRWFSNWQYHNWHYHFFANFWAYNILKVLANFTLKCHLGNLAKNSPLDVINCKLVMLCNLGSRTRGLGGLKSY